MSNNKDIPSSADNNKISLLPEDVQAILQRGMTEGYKDSTFGDGFLSLSLK